MYLLDSSAWVEYFLKSPKGAIVKDLLKKEFCYTSVVSIAEVSSWAHRNGKDRKKFVESMRAFSQIIFLTVPLASLAGTLNIERKKQVKKWGMVDSMILATAKAHGLKVVSKDSDFADLPETQML